MGTSSGHHFGRICDNRMNCCVPVRQELSLVPRTTRENVGKRKQWREVAKEAMPTGSGTTDKNLRAYSRKWLQENGHITKPFATSSFQKRAALIAEFDSCSACSKAWCFTYRPDASSTCLVVEDSGDCHGDKNLKKLKRAHAKKFASRGIIYCAK